MEELLRDETKSNKRNSALANTAEVGAKSFPIQHFTSLFTMSTPSQFIQQTTFWTFTLRIEKYQVNCVSLCNHRKLPVGKDGREV